MSQLLANLERQLAGTVDPETRGELIARIAAYLGRVGRFDEAKRIIDELRQKHANSHSGRVTLWIMLAEGLIYHFAELNPKAIDRVSRALLLGSAMAYRPIVALASAWKAHIQFQSGEFGAMVEALNLSASNSSEADLDAITRRSIVLCNSYMICGDRPTAQKWFEVARRCAVQNGDQASLEALIYNRAAFLTTWLRAENCVAPIDGESLRSVRMEIASAVNFQNLTGISALTVHIHLWDARQHLLSGDYGAAIEKLNAIRQDLPPSDVSFSRAYIDLEVCYCQVRLGLIDAAWPVFSELPVLDLEKLDADEQLVATWMRLGMAKRDDRFGDVERLEKEFERNSIRYSEYKGGLVSSLRNLNAENLQ